MLNIMREKSQIKTINEFIQKWTKKDLPSKQVLYDYKSFCKNLLYYDESIVNQVVDILKKNIILWADQNCSIYKNPSDYIDKDSLVKIDFWYVKSLKNEFRRMSTSGSTSGSPFSYLAWDPFFEFIEAENHYDLILNEFNIKNNPQILCFFGNNFDAMGKFIYATEETNNFLHKHGISRKPTVHHVNLKHYRENQEGFFIYLFKYIKENKFDVFFAPGPEINSLCHYIRKFNYRGKIANLLSNSNAMLLQDDVDFLLNGNYVDNICDHMRCWDGGATFFTCKDKNYHLCDNLSWSEEIEGKLISTDYFSLPSPFIKYWNGDLCKIKNKYERCECGRLYRDFEFIESRPFSLKGISFQIYKKKIINAGISSLKQIKCSSNQVQVVTNEELSENKKEKIKKILHKFNIQFVVEKEFKIHRVINYNFEKNKVDCGTSIAECVVDNNDPSGESYVWQITSGCNNNLQDNACVPDTSVNGTPCVFLGSKTNVSCLHIDK